MKAEPSIYADQAENVMRIVDSLANAKTISSAKDLGITEKDLDGDLAAERAAKDEKAKQREERRSETKTQKLLAKCKAHPAYTGTRRPRTDCETCWDHFRSLHPLEYEAARRDFERKNGKGSETKKTNKATRKQKD